MKKVVWFAAVSLFAIGSLSSCGKTEEKTNDANLQEENAEEAVVDDTAVINLSEAYLEIEDSNAPFKVVDNAIFNENVPVVVDFYADWCPPCKQYSPVFHEVAEKYVGSACFVSVNSDNFPELAKTYNVTSIPTTVFIMPGGAVLGVEKGALPAQKLEESVNQLLATSAGADMEV